MEAAFFDLDKTVIDRASMVALGRPLRKEGLISRRMLVRALWGQLVYLYVGADEAQLERMRSAVLAITKGWDHAHVSRIVREALEDVVAPIVYAEALELVRAHQAAGRRVFLVSASPEEIVAPLARHLGIDEAIATRARLDAQGRYTGELEWYAYGPAKADIVRVVAAREGIDLAASYAYSDSATDLPMLECVGHPVAVNPDRELLRAAREKGWEVRTFQRTVGRPGTTERRPGALVAATLVGGGLVAAGGAGAAWWWATRRGAAASTGDQADRTFFTTTTATAARTRSTRIFFMARRVPNPGVPVSRDRDRDRDRR